jgi:hypothetical protein
VGLQQSPMPGLGEDLGPSAKGPGTGNTATPSPRKGRKWWSRAGSNRQPPAVRSASPVQREEWEFEPPSAIEFTLETCSWELRRFAGVTRSETWHWPARRTPSAASPCSTAHRRRLRRGRSLPAHLRTCGQTQSMLFSSRDMRWIKGDAPALDETPVPRFRRDSAGSGHDLRLRRRWADTAVRRALVPSSPLARSRGEADCTEWRPMDTTVG